MSSELKLRVISSFALIPPVIMAIYLGGSAFNTLVILAACLMIIEWDGISCGFDKRHYLAIMVISAVAPLVIFSCGYYHVSLLILLFGTLATYLVLFVSGLKILWPLLGLFYVFLPSASLMYLRNEHDNGFFLVISLFVMVWATDIGAYFCGRAIGGAKLAPKISPNKTWAGLVGGTLAAFICGLIMSFIVPVDKLTLLIMPWIIAPVSQAGDLFESWYKRRFGVKDSGRLIPGHGGIMDRVDGLVTAAPLFAAYVWLNAQ